MIISGRRDQKIGMFMHVIRMVVQRCVMGPALDYGLPAYITNFKNKKVQR